VFCRLLALGVFLVLNSSILAEGPKKKLFLIGQGPDGHPPQTHEYMAGLRVVTKCLQGVPGLEITTVQADGRWSEGPELLDRADGVVLFLAEGAKWIAGDDKRRATFEKLAARGGGLVALHWAIGTRDAKPIDGFVKLLGGCHGGPDRRYKIVEEDVQVADPAHPISAGIRTFRAKDEFYYRLKFVQPADSIKPVLQVKLDGEQETVAWSWERPGGGRSFGFSGLHFHHNWRLPEYRRLVAQAILWAMKMPIPEKGLPVDVTEADLTVTK
jgi:type 1 glutamine amidotransferase